MKELSLDDLDRRWLDVEAAVDATLEIDRWCSGPDWVVPVHHGFAPHGAPLLLELDSGFALLCRYELADGRTMVAGLEPLWGFASPLIGADIAAVARATADHLAGDPDWDVLLLGGMPTPSGPHSFTAVLVGQLGRLGAVRVGPGITRQVADLDPGYDHWLAARSSRFRRTLSRIEARAEADGVEIVELSDQPEVFDRLMIIEGRTWKGAEASGMMSPEMATTYREMTERLQARGRLRVNVARLAGRDIGYIMGGVRAGHYRGLQLGYTIDAADRSVGHLLQAHQIRTLCRRAEARSYDLGMHLDYKRRWADRAVTSYRIVIDRSGAGEAPR